MGVTGGGGAVGSRFSRVTVVGPSRRLDVSLPSDEPVASQLPTVLRLLGLPPSPDPVRWTLSMPDRGAVAGEESLDGVGVLDGAVLYLTPAAEAPPPPYVHDVDDAAAQAVTDLAPAWAGEVRRAGVAVLATAALAAALVCCAVADSPESWVGAAVTALAGLGVGLWRHEPGGAAAAAIAGPAAAAVALGLVGVAGSGDTPLAVLAGGLAGSGVGGWAGAAVPLAGAAAGVGLYGAGLVRRWIGLQLAGMVAFALSGVATVAAWAGAPADRAAGVVLLAAVMVLTASGPVARGGAGLVDLMRAEDGGERVPRQAVQDAARRGQGAVTGAVWCCAVLGAVALCVLALGPGSGAPDWINRVIAVIGTLIFAVRARLYTRGRQVLPMLGAATVGASAIALAVPGWLGVHGSAGPLMGLILLAVVVVVVLAAGLVELAEVPRARVRRMLDLGDTVCVLALVPLLLLLFAVIPAMQRWMG